MGERIPPLSPAATPTRSADPSVKGRCSSNTLQKTKSISDKPGYRRVLARRNLYAEAATYVWRNGPPAGVDADSWATHGEVFRAEVAELDAVLTNWERANAYR